MHYIYGMRAAEPEACCENLLSRGIGAVVSPPTDAACKAVLSSGMSLWGCIGAFSVREDDPESFLSEDAFGERRRWFGSGCPNEPALWERSFQSLSRWSERGATRVFCDGARFASPCPGNELFLSCFCPRCMRLGKELGYDMPAMRKSVQLFANQKVTPVPADWLSFREACAKRYFDAFAQRARQCHVESAAFVFAPSLGRLVGQTPASLQNVQAIASMLYRAYPEKPGIACLNAEYASLLTLFAERGDASPVDAVFGLTGKRVPHQAPSELFANGFPPQEVAFEIAAAAKIHSQPLAPILQLHDSLLAETISLAQQENAAEIGFFAYSDAEITFLPQMH